MSSLVVACLGAGRMGSQIGCEYALAGHSVCFVSQTSDRARGRVEAALEMAGAHGVVCSHTAVLAWNRMSFHESVGDLGPVDLIVESLPEDRALKRAVVAQAAARWTDATVATNTSSIGIGELGRITGTCERLVATHYWNPPLLMPLVELVAASETAAARRDALAEILRDAGKRPVLLGAEVPGLAWNRLQFALLRECLWLVENGVATPAQIDEIVRDGLARRWRLLGPFETASLGGGSVFDAIAENLFPILSDASTGVFGPHLLDDPAQLGQLALRRDQGLAAALRAEQQQRRAGCDGAGLA